MEKNDTLIDTVQIIEHDIHSVSDSVLIAEIEHRGDRIAEEVENGHYSGVIVQILILVFVVFVIWKKRNNGKKI